MKQILGLVAEGKIEEVRVLGDAEYEEYKRAVGCLLRFSSDQQLFVIVRLNYEDFQNLQRRYLAEYLRNPSMNWPRMERMALNVNRYLLNFLSSIRMFLDHSEANLKERYGKGSHKVKLLKDACTNAYDNHFSYRFLYRLRNYAQHCGLPVSSLSLHSRAVNSNFAKVQHSLIIEFSRDSLLKKHELWGKNLVKEIQNLPQKIEINMHVIEMMKCLEKINFAIYEEDMPLLIQSAKYVQNLAMETKNLPGTPCIFEVSDVLRTPEGKVERLNLLIQSLPMHLVEMITSIANNKKTN